MHRGFRKFTLGAAIAMALLTGCSGHKTAGAPPRTTDTAPNPQEASVISVPIDADPAILGRVLEQEVPRNLWSIDRHSKRCIAPQKVKIFGAKLNVTPPISCTIVGQVTRGPIHLRGVGKEIVADIPLHATISARDIGGVLKGETATGAAMAHAHIVLDIRPDWTPTGKVRLSYDWTTPPGIDFLGQRITFTDQADAKLQPVKRRLEQTLPRELARIDLRRDAEQLWRKSFTSVLLNEKNPPVWMRVTPRRLVYGSYGFSDGRMRLYLALEAVTETFVGNRPTEPAPTPLPPLAKARTDGQLRFVSPVIADYAQLEPVILRALAKRAQRPFILPAIGPVIARFDKVTAYGTDNGRIAVGLTLAAKPVSGSLGETKGQVWLTARPVNAAGSPQVEFRDLQVTGDTDGVGGDLLIQLGNSPGVSSQIAASLTQNFANDLDELLGKIRKAIDTVHEGDFVLRGRVDSYRIGQIHAYGNGLYLPVHMSGNARIGYRPVR